VIILLTSIASIPAEASAGKAAPAPERGSSANGTTPPTQVEAARRPAIAANPLASRIAERVVPVNRQPAVQSMMVLTLSCDHRVVDGARGAQFLATPAELVEEPLGFNT
jgi:hypothetical protein